MEPQHKFDKPPGSAVSQERQCRGENLPPATNRWWPVHGGLLRKKCHLFVIKSRGLFHGAQVTHWWL